MGTEDLNSGHTCMVSTLWTKPSHRLSERPLCADTTEDGGRADNSDLSDFPEEGEETCEDLSANRRHCLCPDSPCTSSLEQARVNVITRNRAACKTLKSSLPLALHPEHVLKLHFMSWTHGHQALPPIPTESPKLVEQGRMPSRGVGKSRKQAKE